MPANQFISSTNLRPLGDYDQHEILPFYALNQTGLGGMAVTLLTGAQDPLTSEGYGSQGIGASYTNIWAPAYSVFRKVRPATIGDTKWEVAGITLKTTAYYDENGNALRNMPYDQTLARGFVQTGQAVPILKRGMVSLALSTLNGTTPFAGYPLIASGNGGFACVTPAYATGTSISNLVIGRVLSSTGTYNGQGTLGGYFQADIAV
jgi:hypothetical protein